MGQWTIPAIRPASVIFLLSVGGLAGFAYLHAPSQSPSHATRADFEADVVQAEGVDGKAALSLFDDDAADLFATNRTAFRDLMAIARLDVAVREISAGPWREAVLQWARAGRLRPFLEHLNRLDPEQRKLLHEVPGCLPLLGRGAREAEAMIARHGVRAWRLFLVVDFADNIEGVERIARALRIHGERMLRVNESHGPALAMLYVPPSGDASELVPWLFSEAIDRLGVEEAGALFLGNYDDLARLALEDRCPAEDLVEALDLLAGQPEVVRTLASDSGLIIRLLLERRGREPIGSVILSRCGPEAADLLFERGGYASRHDEKPAALAILASLGWPGLELLRAFRDDDSWHRLLRRADLIDVDKVPLIVRIAGKLKPSLQRHKDIERYLDMPREQIVEEDISPTFAGQALEWIPGYIAVHTAYNAARGYRIETSDAAWAVLDGVMTISLVGELAGQAIKTVGRQVLEAEVEATIRSVESQVARELVASGGHRALKTLMVQLPGVLPTLTRSLRMRLSSLDVTAVMRSASGVAKKVGVRTWGKLDRRIIMRGDRRVIINLFDPKVVSRVGEKFSEHAIKDLRDKVIQASRWQTASEGGGELGPCIMERILPGLSIKAEEWPSEGPRDRTVPVPPRDLRADFISRLADDPIFLGVGMMLIAVCLALTVPRVKRALGHGVKPKSAAAGITPSSQRRRPYRE